MGHSTGRDSKSVKPMTFIYETVQQGVQSFAIRTHFKISLEKQNRTEEIRADEKQRRREQRFSIPQTFRRAKEYRGTYRERE